MQCTSCETGKLHQGNLAQLLPSLSCDHCGGHFFYLSDYLRWKVDNPEPLQETDITDVEPSETAKVIICPITGRLMRKYRMSNQHQHKIDLSVAVNGIWLDKGEWELLVKSGLSNQLNKIFTDPWQRNIRLEKTTDVLKAQYENRFGEEDYAQLQQVKAWLKEAEHKAEMLAYLVADDPYSV